MRLRNHAKWMFVLLAVVFVFSFVVAGVGSGSTGVSDLFGSVSFFGGSSSSDPVKAAQKKVDKAGKDTAELAPALKNLADAQARKQLTADAEATYKRYLALRPQDVTARQHLALQYKNDADAQFLQLQAIAQDVVQSAPIGSTKLVTDPIQAAVHQDAISHATDFYRAFRTAKQKELTELGAAAARAKGVQRSSLLAQQGPEAFNAFNTAANFGSLIPESPAAADAQKDIAAWAKLGLPALQQVLKLHPKDSLGAQIKQMIDRMKPYAPAAAKS
ncbi:MAG: hypothetical protein QOG85_1685 [Gaiellaceae bacterium]|nr:hypothetical protein [Gaiellaceae bacterium]